MNIIGNGWILSIGQKIAYAPETQAANDLMQLIYLKQFNILNYCNYIYIIIF